MVFIDVSGLSALGGDLPRRQLSGPSDTYNEFLFPAGITYAQNFDRSLLKRLGDSTLKAFGKTVAGWIIEGGIIKIAGQIAYHTTIDPVTIGKYAGKGAAYSVPILDIVYSPWRNAYDDTLKHPERDNVEAMARYFTDFTATTLTNLIGLDSPGLGFTSGVAYDVTREKIQEKILHNPITDWYGEQIYGAFSGTKIGKLLGL